MKSVWALLVTVFCFSLFAANEQVYFEPVKVELIGHLELQTFPGPPNYESIKNGDVAERSFYLFLDNKVDVIVSEKNSSQNSENVFNVGVLQLVTGDDNHWNILKKIGAGGRVKIVGTLFQRITGHHHSRVLLSVNDISLF